jgi:hypothetical protein
MAGSKGAIGIEPAYVRNEWTTYIVLLVVHPALIAMDRTPPCHGLFQICDTVVQGNSLP